MDLVFMVTSTNSVGFSGWSDITSFVSAIVGALNIDDGLVRVGLLKLVAFYSFVFLFSLMLSNKTTSSVVVH